MKPDARPVRMENKPDDAQENPKDINPDDAVR